MTDTFELAVRVVWGTESALLVTSDEESEVWLPRSQVKSTEEIKTGKTICIEIPEWLAIEKELV